MKRIAAITIALALVGCGKAPDGGAGEPAITGNAIAGVAFTYGYFLALPSDRISDLQEAHAQSCEGLGPTRCRITGLRYTVGRQGEVDASLSMKIAAPLARAFGRAAVKRAEGIGATLTGADITGTDVATDAAATATDRAGIADDRALLTRTLARTDLSPAERAELLRQQAALADRTRIAAADATAQRDSLATTPMTFAYTTGRGTGLADRLRDAGDTALASLGVTLTVLLWILTALGPPLLLLALLFLAWRGWGRRRWAGFVDRVGSA